MAFNSFNPVDERVVAHATLLSDQTIGKKISIHTKQNGLPEIENATIAIIGVAEDRNAINNNSYNEGLTEIRRELYQLYIGNWHQKIIDLGDIPQGNSVEDTYFALKEVVSHLVKNNCIPVIIGGSHDLTYANYRAYDTLEQTVNLVSIDRKFDIGSFGAELNSQSFLYKIIMDKPNNLFNYSNLCYQTYFNSQQEIDLVQTLHFDSYRLGDVAAQIELAEPVLRDADIVSIDIGSVRKSDAPANKNVSPNGLYGEKLCAIARYAGISDKVSSFGIYEYNSKLDQLNQTAQLIAQTIWYFIEGVNYRVNEYPFTSKNDYTKYIVLVENNEINFFKSTKSGRWWMEVKIPRTKSERKILIPCTYQDYLNACNQILPERWLNTYRKLI